MNHDEKGDKVAVNMAISDAEPETFDAVLLPGGVANADKLRMDKDAQRFVQSIEKSGKPLAVICHGPWLLVSSGLVKGRHLTSFHTLQDDIRNAGGVWTDEKAVLDKNWISSRTPSDLPAFNEGMLKLFAHRQGKSTAAAHS
jgi:protease I